VSSEPTPPKLLAFDPADWPGPDNEVSWYPAFRRWCMARRAYGRQHPVSCMGDGLDQILHERQVRHDWLDQCPLESPGPVHVYAGEIREGVIDPVSGILRGRLPGEEWVVPGQVAIRYCDWLPSWAPE
jgi:hypothetical protein